MPDSLLLGEYQEGALLDMGLDQCEFELGAGNDVLTRCGIQPSREQATVFVALVLDFIVFLGMLRYSQNLEGRPV